MSLMPSSLQRSLRATSLPSDPSHLDGFDVAVISVPTPLREGLPDLSFIEAAGRDLARHLRPGGVVVLESTTYPGTTTEFLGPILAEGSGLRPEEFYLGYSPERIDPGNTTHGLVNTPKVVSGSTHLTDSNWWMPSSRPSWIRPCPLDSVRRSRTGQAAGEHLPPCQYRARQ
jgi:UDP-N-acetyl-D-mannosaminuronate dehydrogenase